MTLEYIENRQNKGLDAGDELIERLREVISAIFRERSEIALSFSGGIDSTLLSRISLELGEIKCFVAGMPYSRDLRNARKAAQQLDVQLEEVVLDEAAIIRAANEMYEITGVSDPLIISFEMPVYFILKAIDHELMVTGQGADELFGGYAKYEGLSKDEFIARREEDMMALFQRTLPFEDNIALNFEKFIERPFLAPEIISFAKSLPIELVQPIMNRKQIIREALTILGLSELAFISKKAAQYGSGVMSILRKTAKRSGIGIKEMIEGDRIE